MIDIQAMPTWLYVAACALTSGDISAEGVSDSPERK